MLQKLVKQSPMLAKSSAWYYGLPLRDQAALNWMLLALLLFILFFFVWQPVQSFVNKSRAEAEQASADLVWMKENEGRASQLARNNPAVAGQAQLSGKSLLSTVSNSARRYKVELQRFEPRGDTKVNVTLDKVSFNQMMLWISELNQRFGVRVEQISVDKSDRPGDVSARLSLQI